MTAICAWRAGEAVTREQFEQHAGQVSAALPETRWLLNRCANRYHFAVTFLAICRRGATNLLPPGENPAATRELLASFAGAELVDDAFVESALSLVHSRPAPALPRGDIADEHLAALVFTSGSSSAPRPHDKPWRSLKESALHCRTRLGSRPLNVVATVPPQHMYGLETSIFPMLTGDWALDDGAAFYPEDIAAALRSIPAPRLLITAPYHLRHLLASNAQLPPVDKVLSATSPLSVELAREAEQRLGAQLMEIYGCTEAGSMATRRTSLEDDWTPYPGLTFSIIDGQTLVRAAHLPGDVPVADNVELRDGGRIRLLGRDTDMIKIGGRRGSLANIGAKLAALPGVIDQAVFMVGEGETARPAALVVAPERDAATLRQDLGQVLDAVFVPRPLKIVSALPRNELGKLPRESLMKLLRE